MPVAPPECTHDHTDCRIVAYNHRALTVSTVTSVFDGYGMMIPAGTPSGSATAQDCICQTCGLMWTEETHYQPPPEVSPEPPTDPGVSPAVPALPAVTVTNVRKAGG